MPTPDELLDAKVDRSGGPDACWPWTGGITRDGYGYLHVAGKTRMAHRESYSREHGEIPPGMVIDHECHNRSGCTLTTGECPHRRCCNPTHLGAKTNEENIKASPNALVNRTHCLRAGHELTPENILHVTVGGYSVRRCAACKRAHARAAYRAKIDRELLPNRGRPRKEYTDAS